MVATEQIVNTLIGSLLGDGCLSQKCIVLGHDVRQLDYLIFKRNHYIKYGLDVSPIHKNEGKEFYTCRVRIPEPYLCWFSHDRYHTTRGKRYFSKFLLSRISDRGFFFYYLDDGSLYRKMDERGVHRALSASFSLGSYSYENCLWIREAFTAKLGVDAKVRKCGNHYKLGVNATNFRKLFEHWLPYTLEIPECMLYKFDTKYSIEKYQDFTLSYLLSKREKGNTVKSSEDVL